MTIGNRRRGLVALIAAGACIATGPRDGAQDAPQAMSTLPPLGGEMSHVLVTVFEGSLFTGFESPALVPVTLQNPGATFEGGAAALNGTWFNAQYGWLASGVWAPPAGAFVWIEQIDATEGLRCYAGRSFGGVQAFAPIFGTGGSAPRVRWDGAMLHNYYAAETLGPFTARYRIYFGDADGTPIAGGATPAEVELRFAFGNADADANGVVDIEDLYRAERTGAWDADLDGAVTAQDRSLMVRTIRLNERAKMSKAQGR